MLHSRFFMVVFLGAGLLASCGDKLDPIVAEEDPSVDTGTSPATEGNTTIPSDSNTTPANPNITPTTGGNTTTPANGNTTPTTPTGGNTPVTNTSKLCGTNDTKISYATHIAPLVTTTCSSCHAGGGGFSPTMTTYANTKAAFTDRGAQDQLDSGAMPQGRTLTTNQKCLYKTWSTTGYNP